MRTNAQLPCGCHVRIVGLASRPELNEQLAQVIKWEPDRQRYSVRLKAVTKGHATGTLALKPANLVPLDEDVENVLAMAVELEKSGRKREALDALLLHNRRSRDGASRHPGFSRTLSRLMADGEREGWLQQSEASTREATFRSSRMHCAVCLQETPAGQPPPERSCHACGMVQYCCAAHKESDVTHRDCCDQLRAIAWRTLWERNPVCPISLSLETASQTPGFRVRMRTGAEAASLGAQARGGILLQEPTFPEVSRAMVQAMQGWDDFFRADRLQRRWFTGRLPSLAAAPSHGSGASAAVELFGPSPPPSPSGGRPPPAAVCEHIGQEMRLALGEALSDALSAVFALRQTGWAGEMKRRLLPGRRTVSGVAGCADIGGGHDSVAADDDELRLETNDSGSDGTGSDADDLQLEANEPATEGVVLEEEEENATDEVRLEGNVPAKKEVLLEREEEEGADADEVRLEENDKVDQQRRERDATHARDARVSARATGGTLPGEKAPKGAAAVVVHVLGAEEPVEGERGGLFHAALSAALSAMLLDEDDVAHTEALAVRTVHIGPGMAATTRCQSAHGNASYRGSYAHFTRDRHYSRPDVLLAFHPGLYVTAHGYSWLDTLEHAIELDLPFILTALNAEDARCNRDLLAAVQARVLLDLPNPFASPRTRQVYPCENLLSNRNRHIFAFRGVESAPLRLDRAGRAQKAAAAGRAIMRRLQENPLTT